jgi:uncharacterized protein (UPF0248 family)
MNLVFNRWDENNNPLANLSELNTSDECVSFPFFYNDSNFNIKNCKLKDINKNETFYFIITKIYSYTFYIKNGDIFLPKEIEDYIKNYNLKIVFLCEHESNKFIETFMQLLIRKIKKNNWNEKNFFIIDNNSMLNQLKHKFNTNINVFKINYLIQFFSKNPNPPSIDDIVFNKTFIFLCQNRAPHYHRILLLTYLKNLTLFENHITNWSLIMPHSEYMDYTQQSANILSVSHFKNYFDLNNKKLINDYTYICNTKKLCYYKENINWENTTDTYNYSDATDTFKSELNFQNSYINIVTESHYHFREHDVHITEKSFKPFYFFQLPIFVASYQHVKMIKEEYNFYLFDDLIDHSYDNEIDDAKRFHMIINEIKRLSTMREEIALYYKNNIDKLIHNHNLIKNNNYEEIFKQYILNI